jgi:transposase
MQDTELYRHVLGLEKPWKVDRVELDIRGERVDVWAVHEEGLRWACPECRTELAIYDHAPERIWRHLDTCQFKTFLHARVPRVECPTHGVKQVSIPWAEAKSRFTALFERLAIDMLQVSDIEGASKILRVSWDEAWGIMERAVARGKKRKKRRVMRKMGVDEKSAARGHNYLTIVSDLERGTVEYLGDHRDESSLDGYLGKLSPKRREKIESIAVDMWDPYLASIRKHVPDAEEKVVFDRYHLMTHMGKAVDEVRKAESREMLKNDDERLKGTKYLWLYSKENVPKEKTGWLRGLRRMNLRTARAWAIKENFRELWRFFRRSWAEKHFKAWFFWATHSKLAPVITAAWTFKRHLAQILTYVQHRITNAVSEGLNSKIQTIKKKAYGFRNRENFKTSIFFHCGGLNLYPVTHKNV